jgi:N-carbamoylputrescine amidase
VTVRVALAQFAGVEDRSTNLARVEALIAEAADAGARIVAFHELATTPYFCYGRDPKYLDWAEPVPGESTDRVSAAADEHGVHVLFPLYERDGDSTFNTAALIAPGEGVVGTYRKSHVPKSGDVADERGGDEDYYFQPGDTGFNVWSTPLGLKIGVLTCYDRHFPEAARAYGLQGANLIFVPTASYRKFIIETMWETELQTMAWQNTFYVAGINKVGPLYQGDPSKAYPGRSVIVSPGGEILARAGDQEGIITADVDPDAVDESRKHLRFYEYRRPELYSLVTKA